MIHPTVLLLLPALAVLPACQSRPASKVDARIAEDCRVEADRVYAAQNRVDLSRRDGRDTPFSASYASGITSAGLGSRYGRDTAVNSCLNNSTAGKGGPSYDYGTGPTFRTTTQ